MKVGDRPLDFTGLDQHEKAITLSNCQRPLVLAFLMRRFGTGPDGKHRSDRYVKEFFAQFQKLKDAGLFVVVVSMNYYLYNAEITKELNSDLVVIDDCSNHDLAMAYSEVPDLITMNRVQPVYVIDESFTIVYASHGKEFYEDSYTETINQILGQFQIEKASTKFNNVTELS